MLSAAEIRSERATDAYFDRTVETLEYAGKNPTVVAEVTASQFATGSFAVCAGLKDCASLLTGVPVDVDALREGQLFDGGPVLQIRGEYLDFARYETSILGFLSHASGIATKSLFARRSAPGKPMYSFGTRHVHPAIAPMVERCALIGGLDGLSHVAAGDVIGRDAGGTMPHALLLCFGRGEQEAAWLAFDAAVEESVPRIALCDTFSDEVDESVRAAKALGDSLDSVRLDTTSSRRGDFRSIVREVRWELDQRGFEDVGIFVSGGLDPVSIAILNDVVDGYGIGGYVSNADPIDFALDIVQVNGEVVSKRGKLSGPKAVARSSEGEHVISPRDRERDNGESLLRPLIRAGEVVRDFDLDEAIARCDEDADLVGIDAHVTELIAQHDRDG